MASLLEHVKMSLRDRKLLAPGQRVLVAVSGGVDSVVLLHLLQALAAKHRWKLTVAHFNHRLRGRESEADERFVRRLAGRLKLPCRTGRGDVRKHARANAVSLEMAARELRHQFLARTARALHGAPVAMAHHADDQVELFFLRLLRGSGPEGLSGMKWRSPSPADNRVWLIRPLLDVSRADLKDFARANRIRFREDRSNASGEMLRNRIRHQLLPFLRRRFQPALSQTVLRLIEILSAESEALAEVARGCFNGKRAQAFASLPVALQRRIIRRQLHEQKQATDFDLIEFLHTHANRAVSVGPGISICRDAAGRVKRVVRERASFDHAQLVVGLGERAGETQFDGVRFQWHVRPAGRFSVPKPGRGRERFDLKRVGSRVVLRHWRAGDRFQPIGLKAPVRLQDWFTNRKVPRSLRRRLVVAATMAGEIFWVEGGRIGERFKLTRQTEQTLHWRWKRA